MQHKVELADPRIGDETWVRLRAPLSHLASASEQKGSDERKFERAPSTPARGLLVGNGAFSPLRSQVNESVEGKVTLSSDCAQKRDMDESGILQLAKAMSSARGKVQMKFSLLTTASFTAGVANGSINWDPSGIADFVTMAGLFSEYKIDALKHECRIPSVTNTTDWTDVATVYDDPAAIIAPGLVVSADADKRTLLYPFTGNPTVHQSKPQLALAALAQPSNGGWLRTSIAWPGRLNYYVASINGASTAVAVSIQSIWTISFRARG
jgi:hypothetical protein